MKSIWLVLAGLIIVLTTHRGHAEGLDTISRYQSGFARVIDGDTIVIHGIHIRIWGIDTPPAFASDREHGPATIMLERKGLDRSSIIAAGIRSKDALERLTAGRQLICITVGTSYNRMVSKCSLDGDSSLDLSCEMLKTGWAVEWKEYSRGELTKCLPKGFLD
jgi:endonuclease YncB( thermonuclease family)